MTERSSEKRIEINTTQARGGVTGHNVRYVLAVSLSASVVLFAALWYFFAA